MSADALEVTRAWRLEGLGVAFARIALACEELPDDKVKRVVRTLEHAAEVLEVEAGR